MTGQRLYRALDLERRAYPANASPPGARWFALTSRRAKREFEPHLMLQCSALAAP
jgi:hypothetical protein